MKGPLKVLILIGVILLVLVGSFVLISGKVLGSTVTAGVNKFAPKVTGTEVVLDSAFISALSGSGSLSGLSVGNPEGWSDRNLASIAKVHVDVDPFSLLSNTWVVEEVILEAPEFSYETKIVSSNVKDLLKQIEETAASVGITSDGEPADEATEVERRYAVKRFVMRNAKVTVGLGATAVTVPVPDLELNDLGSPDKGLTTNQLILAVSKEITGDIVLAATGALKTMGGTAGASAADEAKKAGEALKGIFKKGE